MLRYQWIDDRYETNPFISKIHVGSQILLIDAFGNEYFFTVKNIDGAWIVTDIISRILDRDIKEIYNYN